MMKKKGNVNTQSYIADIKAQIETLKIENSAIKELSFIQVCNSKDELKTSLLALKAQQEVAYANYSIDGIIQWTLFKVVFENNRKYAVSVADTNELWVDQFIYEIIFINT